MLKKERLARAEKEAAMVSMCKVPTGTEDTLLAGLGELGKEVEIAVATGRLNTEKGITDALRDGTVPIAVRHRVDGVLPPEKAEAIRAWRKEVEARLLGGIGIERP